MTETRQTFFERISFLAPSNRFLIRKAYDIAKATHRGQERMEVVDGKPLRYFEHPRRVAIIMIDELAVTVPELIALALIHDVLEDAPSRADMSPEYLEYCFWNQMVQRAQLLTIDKAPPNEDTQGKIARKNRYVAKLDKHGDVETLLVKACDRLDNLRSMRHPEVSISFIKRKSKETREKYLPVFAKMPNLAIGTPYQRAATLLNTMVLEELVRCEEYAKMYSQGKAID